MRVLLNLIWLVFGGLVMAFGYAANLKLIPVSLTPFGRDILDVEQARRLELAGPAIPAR